MADLQEKISLAEDASLPIVILANKFDIPGCNIPRAMLDSLSERRDIIGWFSTSAKENLNIGNYIPTNPETN